MPARVFTAQERPFESLEHVGIVITLLREQSGQQHVGILHRDESAEVVRVLHLAWHHNLRNSIPKASYAWIAPTIPGRRARQVAAFCRRVIRMNPAGIPYAFSPATDCFNAQTGEFLLGANRKGLTCASFVLAVFHSTGLPLIQYDSWPTDRPGDEQWQRHIIEQLKADNASPEHIRDVEAEIGAIRYRPEDVAGAGASDELPAGFIVAEKLGREILEKLRANNLHT
jgi:hypothetical protein